MCEIDREFFEKCRKEYVESGEHFYPIKEWALGSFRKPNEKDYGIKLTFHIISKDREQLNLNKEMQGLNKPEKGVGIPPDKLVEVAEWLLKQLGPEAYQEGQCEKEGLEEAYGYKFEIIKKFDKDNFTDINLKLMHNLNETKYFLNTQKKFGEYPHRKGVEIPKQMLEQIAQCLVIASEKMK
jgi:hypothetical protein